MVTMAYTVLQHTPACSTKTRSGSAPQPESDDPGPCHTQSSTRPARQGLKAVVYTRKATFCLGIQCTARARTSMHSDVAGCNWQPHLPSEQNYNSLLCHPLENLELKVKAKEAAAWGFRFFRLACRMHLCSQQAHPGSASCLHLAREPTKTYY